MMSVSSGQPQQPHDLFAIIWNDIAARWQHAQPFVLGVTGIDAAGKTRFAEAFAAYVTRRHTTVQLLHLDDFHHPRAVRSSGADEVENYYTCTFDLERLIALLLRPLREQRHITVRIPRLDLATDRYTHSQTYCIDRHTLVVFEGVFLLRPELAPFLDYTVFLDIPWHLAKARAQTRDVPRFGVAILARYHRKYLPAQRRYLAAFPPTALADMIIDNRDWDHPRITLKRGARDSSGTADTP
jgi:uridine kinase